MNKGREQFWSLLLVAINIIVTSMITLATMEIGEDTLRSTADLANLLHCSLNGNKDTLRRWFKNLDRYQYVIGNTDNDLLKEKTGKKLRCCSSKSSLPPLWLHLDSSLLQMQVGKVWLKPTMFKNFLFCLLFANVKSQPSLASHVKDHHLEATGGDANED